MTIVDSDVWSEAFRRRLGVGSWQVKRLIELVEAEEVQLIGPVRQEVLCGIRDAGHFEKIRDALRAFPDAPIGSPIFELAASYFNLCRRHGVQGAHTDFLICACASSWDMRILSKDLDYEQYARHIPVAVERE